MSSQVSVTRIAYTDTSSSTVTTVWFAAFISHVNMAVERLCVSQATSKGIRTFVDRRFICQAVFPRGAYSLDGECDNLCTPQLWPHVQLEHMDFGVVVPVVQVSPQFNDDCGEATS